MATLRVCFVGDSITNGTGDDAYLGWPGRLCAAERASGHDLTCYNLGIRSDTSVLIEARWRAECAARLPDMFPGALVFAFGVNDTALPAEAAGVRVPLDQSLGTARRILSAAKAWKPTLWIGPAPVEEAKQPVQVGSAVSFDFRNARVASYSQAYAALAAELGVPYLDLFDQLADDAVWARAGRAGDGVHPSGEGYAAVAARVGAWDAWRAWLG